MIMVAGGGGRGGASIEFSGSLRLALWVSSLCTVQYPKMPPFRTVFRVSACTFINSELGEESIVGPNMKSGF